MANLRSLVLLIAAGAGLARAAAAAEVVGVAAAGREVFVRLEPGEQLSKGAQLALVPKGRPLQVVEVVGQHARLQSDLASGAKLHQKVSVPRSGPQMEAPPREPWKVAPAKDAQEAARERALAEQWEAWSRKQTPWIDDPRPRGQDPDRRLDGQVTVVAAGVRGGQGEQWALLRIGNNVQWQGIGGSPLSWRHDAAIWVEQWLAQPGASERRAMQVRQAQLSVDPNAVRAWGAALGRVWVPEGAGSATVDGATLLVRPLPQLEITGFGGLLPSIVSTGFRQDAWRVGGAARLRGTVAGWQSVVGADWSTGKVAGGWDRQLGALLWRAEHPRLGLLQGDFGWAAGQADLSGTAWADQGPAKAGWRPVRAVVDYAPTWLGDWRPRLRYTFLRSELTRELAWVLPNQGWSTATSHSLSAWLDLPSWRGWQTSTALWSSLTASEDPWESWRFGGTLQALRPNWPGPNWNGQLVAVVQTGPYLSGGSLSAGADWSPGPRWRWHARLRWSHDRVETSSSSAEALDVRAGMDWGRHPWIIGMSVGGRQTLWTDVPAKSNWLDATATLTYRL